MSMKLNSVAGGIASSFVTKTLLVANQASSQSVPTVQRQQTSTVNTYRVTSASRTFGSARKASHLFKA